MGTFADHMRSEWNGHVIDVEARSTFWGMEYSLAIDNRRVDTINGLVGTFLLRGDIPMEEPNRAVPVTVRVKQGWFGAEYSLEVEGAAYNLTKVF